MRRSREDALAYAEAEHAKLVEEAQAQEKIFGRALPSNVARGFAKERRVETLRKRAKKTDDAIARRAKRVRAECARKGKPVPAWAT